MAYNIVQDDIINIQAYRELESYNNTKTFVGIHSLVVQYLYRKQTHNDIIQLKQDNPSRFVDDISNLKQNIRRIKSNIRTKKYKDEQELKSWLENLHRAEIKYDIFLAAIRE